MHLPHFVSRRAISSLILIAKAASRPKAGRLLKRISCLGSLTRDENHYVNLIYLLSGNFNGF